MSLTNATLTSSLTYFATIQPAQPFVLSSSVSLLPPRHLAPVTQQMLMRRRHGNRLGRRSLNLANGRSSQVLVSAKGGTKRIAINADGSVKTTTTPNSVYSALEVLLLCSVASDLNIDFPHCLTRDTASTTGNQSIMSFVLLFFRHSARYLCIDSKARVYSLHKVGDYRSMVNECIFQHDIYASNYDTYHSRQYSPGGARNGSDQQSPGCHGLDRACYVGRWYLSVKGSNVTTRKTSKVKPRPPQSALFIQSNVESSSFKDTGLGPLTGFSIPGPTLTLPATESMREHDPKRRHKGKLARKGRRKSDGGRTTSPFSVRVRGQTTRGRRKCRGNLLRRECASKITKTTPNANGVDRKRGSVGND